MASWRVIGYGYSETGRTDIPKNLSVQLTSSSPLLQYSLIARSTSMSRVEVQYKHWGCLSALKYMANTSEALGRTLGVDMLLLVGGEGLCLKGAAIEDGIVAMVNPIADIDVCGLSVLGLCVARA